MEQGGVGVDAVYIRCVVNGQIRCPPGTSKWRWTCSPEPLLRSLKAVGNEGGSDVRSPIQLAWENQLLQQRYRRSRFFGALRGRAHGQELESVSISPGHNQHSRNRRGGGRRHTIDPLSSWVHPATAGWVHASSVFRCRPVKASSGNRSFVYATQEAGAIRGSKA